MKTVIAAAMGECVHVAGIFNFLRLAEMAGWRTVFLGPAVPVETIIQRAMEERADLVGVSYRLTPENGEVLIGEFMEAADELRTQGIRFAFGGTPPVAERARRSGFFERVFDGSETEGDVLNYLKENEWKGAPETYYPQSTIERIRWKKPYPILRHHFGLPSMESTAEGINRIAESRLVDVISLGIDQDAQENFFHPERQVPQRKGAGGVPVRSPEDYKRLYTACQTGNFPLLRTYSGTDEFIALAEMVVETIHNAWCAIPLYWFNQMDGRGPWDLAGSIREHQVLMGWYGDRGIPVEVNEPHHWGMRDAPDVIYTTAAYLAAYNARHFGVKDYIAAMMFNCPPGVSGAMDAAKILAILDLLDELKNPGFRVILETRTGLLSYPLQEDAARAHLASSIYLQMGFKPDIVHVVGFTEAHHAATADDVIASARMAHTVIAEAVKGAPDIQADPIIQSRKQELIAETKVLIDAIRILGDRMKQQGDPLSDPIVLAEAVRIGLLDAPQLLNNAYAAGKIRTRIIAGKCLAVDSSGKPVVEKTRTARILMEVDHE